MAKLLDPTRHTPIRTVKAAALVALLVEMIFGLVASSNGPSVKDVSVASLYAAVALGVASLVVLPLFTNARTRDFGYTRGVMLSAMAIYQLTGAAGLTLSWFSNDPIYVAAFGTLAAVLTLLTPPAYR